MKAYAVTNHPGLVLSLLVCLFQASISYSQEVRIVSAVFTYYAPKSMSVDEAERNAIEGAKIKAIADEFGTEISQATSTLYSSNLNEEGMDHFFYLGSSDVRGEWIETIGKPVCDISFDDRNVVVRCEIKGKARESSSRKVELEVTPLRNAPNMNFSSREFYNGDQLFLFLKSPISGYVNIFLLNENEDKAYCLLPYKKSKNGAFFIESDHGYFLFSKEKATKEMSDVDEYKLSSSDNREFNDLIVVFSPSEYNKPPLKLDKDAQIPRVTSISKFNEWLSKVRLKNSSISITSITLTISYR